MKFPVLSIEAWADGESSWTWNSWYRVGWVEISDFAKFPNESALDLLFAEGYLNRTDGGEVEDDGHNLVILDASTREPLFAIEYGNQIL
jgi:hypothetical protein